MCCCSAWSRKSLLREGLDREMLAPGWLAEDWFCISNFLFSLSSSAKIATLFLFWKPCPEGFAAIFLFCVNYIQWPLIRTLQSSGMRGTSRNLAVQSPLCRGARPRRTRRECSNAPRYNIPAGTSFRLLTDRAPGSGSPAYRLDPTDATQGDL